jgi:MFS family permease
MAEDDKPPSINSGTMAEDDKVHLTGEGRGRWFEVEARHVVLAACFVGALATFPGHSFGWAFYLPAIEIDLAISKSSVSAMWTFACLMTAPSMVLGGHFVSRYGMRKSIQLCTVCFAGTVAAVSTIQSYYVLCLACFAMRTLGPGMMIMICQTAIGNWFCGKDRGRAASVFVSATWLSLCIDNGVVEMQRVYGWRDSYVIMSCAILALMAPVLLVFRDAPTASAGGSGEQGDADAPETGGAADEAGGLPQFTLAQAMHTPTFWAVGIGQCAVEAYFVGTNYHIVDLFRSSDARLGPSHVAAAQSAGAAAAIAATVGTGFLMDKLPRSRQRHVLAGALCTASGGCLLVVYCQNLGMAVLACAAISAVGGASDVVTSSLYASLFGREHLASILGAISGMAHVCVGTSPLIFGLVMDRCGSFAPMLVALACVTGTAAAAVALCPAPALPRTSGAAALRDGGASASSTELPTPRAEHAQAQASSVA